MEGRRWRGAQEDCCSVKVESCWGFCRCPAQHVVVSHDASHRSIVSSSLPGHTRLCAVCACKHCVLNCGCKIDEGKIELTFAASSNGDAVKHPAAKFQLRL